MDFQLGKYADMDRACIRNTGSSAVRRTGVRRQMPYLLRTLNLVEAFENAPDDPVHSLIARIPKDKLLGKTIEDLKRREGFDEKFIEALKNATKARNFIAHESAHFSPAGRKNEAIHGIEVGLRREVRELAVGDHRVSEVLLAIEDWESALGISWIEERYADILESWVLFPMKGLLRDEGMRPLPYPAGNPWFEARRAADIALAAKFQAKRPPGATP